MAQIQIPRTLDCYGLTLLTEKVQALGTRFDLDQESKIMHQRNQQEEDSWIPLMNLINPNHLLLFN